MTRANSRGRRSRRSGRPSGCSSDRSGGGPPPGTPGRARSRAREHVPHSGSIITNVKRGCARSFQSAFTSASSVRSNMNIAGVSGCSLPRLWSIPQVSSPKRRRVAVSRALPAQISMQKGSVGVRTTPWRLKDHVEFEEETSAAGRAGVGGGRYSGPVAAAPTLICTFQGAVEGFLGKMSFATVGSASADVDEGIGVVDPHCPGRPWANPRYPGVPVDVVTSAGRCAIVSGDAGRGGRASGRGERLRPLRS